MEFPSETIILDEVRRVMISPMLEDDDWQSAVAVYNYFITESMEAYGEQPVTAEQFKKRHLAKPGYPLFKVTEEDATIGIAGLSPFHHAETISRTIMVSYFLLPSHTGQGIGTRLLHMLIEHGTQMGAVNFIAHISSKNHNSIKFHEKHGFHKCGRVSRAGIKNDQFFDIVWMQKSVEFE
ncbi:MAG: N-acetyltransferase [Desulfobulbaceae bacterium]|nr:MAG: N-acetyltransferase [Desulfobulbaceae bacterium]